VPKATFHGLSIHYQQMGHGPDLVMIHGLFANLAFWYFSVLPALVRDFRVTVYDLRGHGYSDIPRFGYTSSDLAADLHDLLDHLGIEWAHIVGHSYGATVALHHAVAHPERVRSLTLADARVPSLQPALPPPNALHWKLLERKLRQAGIEVPEDLPRVAYSWLEELALLRWREGGEIFDFGNAARFLDGWKANSRLVHGWIQLMRTTSAPKDLCEVAGLTEKHIRQVTRPALAIFGEYSSCLTTLRGLEQNLPNCKTVIVPGVGHFHPVLRPALFVQSVRQFILDVGA
jgi:pimeloyl-ACP methyl ester carboxylesterase